MYVIKYRFVLFTGTWWYMKVKVTGKHTEILSVRKFTKLASAAVICEKLSHIPLPSLVHPSLWSPTTATTTHLSSASTQSKTVTVAVIVLKLLWCKAFVIRI